MLAADAGASDEEIAISVGVGGSTIYRTKRRFLVGNLEEALSEEPRPGASASSRVKRKRCPLRPPVPTHRRVVPVGPWSCWQMNWSRLTEHDSIPRETVRRRLTENDLKPWRKDLWCIPHIDGEYVARMEDVPDLYAQVPDPKRPVVCFDESPTQLIGEVGQPIQGRLSGFPCKPVSLRQLEPALEYDRELRFRRGPLARRHSPFFWARFNTRKIILSMTLITVPSSLTLHLQSFYFAPAKRSSSSSEIAGCFRLAIRCLLLFHRYGPHTKFPREYPIHKAVPGQRERYDCEYRRNGTVNLFIFLDAHRPWRKVKVTERRTAEDFAICMRELSDAHFPEADRIRVVLDNLSTHSPGALYQAFPPCEARRVLRRLEFHYVPKARQLVEHGGD